MADPSDAQFYSTIWKEMHSFYIKKNDIILEKNKKLTMLLKDKTGSFRGISCFLGASHISDSLGAMHCPLCLSSPLGAGFKAMALC